MYRFVIIFLILIIADIQIAFGQYAITHNAPKPGGRASKIQPTPKINYFAKAKSYFDEGNYDQASKILSNMQKWNSEAYELAGDICYLWNATLWYTYYQKASEMGSESARQKLHRNIRSNVICVIGRTISYVYSSQDKYSNTHIQSVADVESLKCEAENGNSEAQFNLGRMYEYGDWVGQDYSKAAYWYDKLREDRHIYSTINLAWLYSEGLGVVKNEQKAFNLYMVAANKDMDDAIHNLGLCYEYGKGVKADKVEALKWYRKNLDRRYNPVGQLLTVDRYYNIVYMQKIKDPQKLTINACYWLYKYLHRLENNHDAEIDDIIHQAESIGVDDPEIMSEFGSYFIFHRNVKKYEEALKWLRLAENQNERKAIRNIGYCYENGLGVSKNYAEAKKYYLKARELGYNADYDLKRLEKKGY